MYCRATNLLSDHLKYSHLQIHSALLILTESIIPHLTVLGRRYLTGKLKRKPVSCNLETGFPFNGNWMSVACWTRWQQHVLHEGFPNLLECIWKLPSSRTVLLLVFKEKTGSLENFIKQITAALLFFPGKHRETHKQDFWSLAGVPNFSLNSDFNRKIFICIL